jgi:hypothetical protein
VFPLENGNSPDPKSQIKSLSDPGNEINTTYVNVSFSLTISPSHVLLMPLWSIYDAVVRRFFRGYTNLMLLFPLHSLKPRRTIWSGHEAGLDSSAPFEPDPTERQADHRGT